MIDVELNDEGQFLSSEQLQLVKDVLNHAAKEVSLLQQSEVSVTFTTEEDIHELNREHRGIDRPTDVLSFALNDETGEFDPTFHEVLGLPNLLGDIVISVPHVERQAADYGHSFERELAFLVVHGFLHLLGYDHMNKEEEKQMFTKQEEILQSYGLGRSES